MRRSRRLQSTVRIRSGYASERARELVSITGWSVTMVVEEALRAYAPPPPIADDGELPPGLIRKGGLLVLTGGPRVTLEEANAMIEEGRNWGGSIHDDDEECCLWTATCSSRRLRRPTTDMCRALLS